ncbi:protein DMP7-like [Mangifera indica]|uniref:protein DMP7-like n=1 Tax=Mangifera indica TaxID=29780 RepID=UPI001CF96892|nr:protein DMP7-like [Mangifera indica]
MEIKIENGESTTTIEDKMQPLLQNAAIPLKQPKTPAQKAIRKTIKGTGHLIRLLPTGSVLTFQIVSPILTHQGKCPTHTNRVITLAFLALCGLSCFILRLTDSFRDERAKVRHGLATFRGLWVLDTPLKLSPEEAARYRLKFIDFFHAFASILVFAAVALFDKNVVNCFCPHPSDETKELLVSVPVCIGVACSILFVLFPSKRHGIGSSVFRNQ